MTAEQIEQWKVERDIARKSGNKELVQIAYDHRDDMMMECISHQSTRTKRLVDDVDTIKGQLAPCVESDKEFRAAKERAKGIDGGSIFGKRGKYAVAAGGGAAIIEIAEWVIELLKNYNFGG